MTSTDLRGSSRLYIAAVVTAGMSVVLGSMYTLYNDPVSPHWLMLAVLTLLSGSFTIRIPGIPARLSVSETFVFAAALLFGAPAATMTVVLDTLVISFWLGRTSTPQWSRITFNVAAAAVAIWVATQAFYLSTNIPPLATTPRSILPLLPWLLLLATVYFLLNSWLVALVVGFQKQRSPLTVWRQNFLWLSLNYYSGASIAALILPYLMQKPTSAYMYVIGVILPVLLISYLTFKTALGRIDDANKHLTELNTLYLSTIETLAMAIDAKDQITHGHIRRVQQYAVKLARHLGITDTAQISAIEAASLLHDMGKLAVPEYILNKPGKLTPAEFDRMKLHASIGADILSAIEFPYPVVPIVRHHHENWDGNGYPDGLQGTDIPIGARILSVVDCFDALTSDRPYRPRMSDAEAVRILQARRGTMYDPAIVDAFIAIHAHLSKVLNEDGAFLQKTAIAFEAAIAERHSSVENNTAGSAQASLDEITASTEETLVLHDLAIRLTGHVELSDVGDVIAKHLRRIIPASAIVFYVYDSHGDDLVSTYATGTHSSNLLGLRVPRGERLSGWVAANKQTIVNADPSLDLGEVARLLRPRFRSCMSTPLVRQQELVGVLSIYSVDSEPFTENHKRLMEVIGKQVAQTVHLALTVEQHRARDSRDLANGLMNVRHLEKLAAASSNVLPNDTLSVIFVSVRQVGPHLRGGHDSQERAIETVANWVRKALRAGDLLFQYSGAELVVLLTQTDSDTASLVSQRIEEIVAAEISTHAQKDPGVVVHLGVATGQAGAQSVQDLVATARRRGTTPGGSSHSPAVH